VPSFSQSWTRFRGNITRHSCGLILAALLAVSAFLMSVALATPQFPWLSFATLIPLFVAIRILPPVQAFWAGAFWGASFAAFAAWLAVPGLTLDGSALFLLATVPGLYCLAASWFTRAYGFNPFFLALGWLDVELALGPIGLRAGLLAGTQQDGWLMQTIGQSLGYLLVSYVVVLINGLLFEVATRAAVLSFGGFRRLVLAYQESVTPVVTIPMFRPQVFRYSLLPRPPPQDATRN
jgi:apolipoprotein N-acyltransferase